MIFFSSVSKAAIFGVSAVQALKVGLLSDLHLNLRYDPDVGPHLQDEGDCFWGSGVPSKEHAPMGRYGCDPPVILLE